jgi:hypothetical protein
LLVGAGVACALGAALDKPVIGVHHLEGHLLSPFLSADPPQFPFVALLVSGGHTQLMRVDGVGSYELLGETIDDAAGEAFDKSAKLMGLGYPGGPALARLAEGATPGCLQAAAAPAAQREPGFFLRRPEDRRAGTGAPHAERRARRASPHFADARRPAPTWLPPQRRRLWKCWCEIAGRPATDRASPAGGGGRGGRQSQLRADLDRVCAPGRYPGALPGAAPVHRQRRHDRAGGSHAPAGGQCKRPTRPTLSTSNPAGRSTSCRAQASLMFSWVTLLTGTSLASVRISTPFSSLAALAGHVNFLRQLVGGLVLALGFGLGFDAHDTPSMPMFSSSRVTPGTSSDSVHCLSSCSTLVPGRVPDGEGFVDETLEIAVKRTESRGQQRGCGER